MPEPEQPRASATRAAILDAAEAVFAEHGFAGARIDRIADRSGHNKTLIFRYFDDKLGLYAAVLRRIDQQASEPLLQLIRPLLADESLFSDRRRFKDFFKVALSTFFDFMLAHPHVMRMIIWEHAEGWQTYTRVASVFAIEGIQQLEVFSARAQAAGIFRARLDPFLMFLLAEQICWTYPTSLPFYQILLPGRDLSSPAALAQAREQIVDFIIAGLIVEAQ